MTILVVLSYHDWALDFIYDLRKILWRVEGTSVGIEAYVCQILTSNRFFSSTLSFRDEVVWDQFMFSLLGTVACLVTVVHLMVTWMISTPSLLDLSQKMEVFPATPSLAVQWWQPPMATMWYVWTINLNYGNGVLHAFWFTHHQSFNNQGNFLIRENDLGKGFIPCRPCNFKQMSRPTVR